MDEAGTYRRFFASAPDAMLIVDEGGVIVDVNDRCRDLFGYNRAQLVGNPVEMLLPEVMRHRHERHRRRYAGHPAPRPMGRGLDLRARRADGSEFPVDISLSPLPSQQKTLFAAAVRDVSDRAEADARLRDSEARFRAVFEHAPIGMALLGLDGRFLEVNDALCSMLGVGRADLTGRSTAELTPAEDSTLAEQLTGRVLAGDVPAFTIEKRYLTHAGRVLWVELTIAALRDGGTGHALAMVSDVTARKEAEARLSHLALHDPLTGLPNRTLADDRLRQALAHCARDGNHVGLLFVDLDHFKELNDRLGHEAGDRVLAEIGTRVAAAVRPADTAARFGGDELVVCCDRLSNDRAAAEREVESLAHRVIASISQPMAIDGEDVVVTASIGATLTADSGTTPSELIRRADRVMYEVKAQGGGRVLLAPASDRVTT